MKRTNPFYVRMKEIILLYGVIFFVGTFCLNKLDAADNPFSNSSAPQPGSVTGIVTDPEGKPVSNVIVSIKGTVYTTKTDQNGYYSVQTGTTGPILVFEKNEFDVQEIGTTGQSEVNVILKPVNYVNIIWGKQRKEYITSSVSTIMGEEIINLPGTNRTNVLGGRLPGLTVQQSNGMPGIENNSLYIRGLNSLNNTAALIVVDGHVRTDASYLNANDIESVTILKDASATAIYGLRSGSGVVLITTRRGKEDPIKVSLDSYYGFQQPTKLPKYLESYDYAYLYNEASRNDGGENIYDEAALEAYRTGSDPHLYPNVSWMNEFLNEYSSQQKYNLSVRGGSNAIQYYASAGYMKNGGIYNIDPDANLYNTNQEQDVFMLRTNVDVRITPKLLVNMDMGIRQQGWVYPGNISSGVNNVISTLYQLPPNAHPVFNADSSLSGTTQYTSNPYGMLNNSGYSMRTTRATDASFGFSHDLGTLTKGLSVRGSVSFDSYFTNDIRRHKGFYVYEGSLSNQRGVKSPENQVNESGFSSNQRVIDVKFGLDYERTFGLSEVYGRVFINDNTYSVDGSTMPRIYRGLMGRLNYAYNGRYLADLSFGYQASEQTSDNKRYILFPALSLGWILTEEDFLSNNQGINFLKVRASHGLTGNDAAISYYQKLSFYESVGTGYLVGTSLAPYGGFREGVLGNPDIMPEISRKSNLGFDAAFLNSKLSLSADLFFEKTTGIITTLNNVPAIIGTRLTPTGNAGIVDNKGFEIELGFGEREKEFKYGLSGNLAYARSKIIDMQEQEYPFAHNYRTGHPVGSRFGLESLGFYYDEDEIAASPVQTYGPVTPGDLRYKDLTDDNIIDIDDITKIGKSWMPEFTYGANLFFSFMGFDFNALLQGIANTDMLLSNYAYYDFYPNAAGKLMEHHLERWAYYPALDIDTRETANYPRLSLSGDNTNNKSPNSTFWLKDASYLRLKSVELGFSIPEKALRFIGLAKLRVFTSAYNVFTFDNIEVIDPEMGNSAAYPIQRMINFGLNAQF